MLSVAEMKKNEESAKRLTPVLVSLAKRVNRKWGVGRKVMIDSHRSRCHYHLSRLPGRYHNRCARPRSLASGLRWASARSPRLGSILFHTLNPALSLPDQSLRLLIYSVSTGLLLIGLNQSRRSAVFFDCDPECAFTPLGLPSSLSSRRSYRNGYRNGFHLCGVPAGAARLST